ncbi:MAG: putative acyltransferase [Proteobacteria bacterium]|jgi:predicted LPLAT superfamily acyltransferase|nr:putative acyltransferase [Pseudomonadota bacterium]
MSRRWMGQQERGSPFLIQLIARITLALGRPAGRLLLYPITLYFVLFSRQARRASRRFLGRALGRPAALPDVFRHYHTFAATILDRVYLLSGRQDDFDIEMYGEEALLDQLAGGRGCLLLGSHLGSFDVLRALAEKRPEIRVRPLMYGGNAVKINTVLNALNPRLAAQVISIGEPDSLLRVKDAIDSGEVVGILGDRDVLDDKSVECRFFGQPCRLPAGPLLLAGLLGTPVVLFFGLYEGGRRYRVRFELLTSGIRLDRDRRTQQVADWTRQFAGRLEHYCRQAPYNWFNFYDFWGEDDVERGAL